MILDLLDDENKRAQDHTKTKPFLKLVVSNPMPSKEIAPSQEMASSKGFSCEILKKNESIYSLIVRDAFHYLDSELILEIEDINKNDDHIEALCHFPYIADEYLNDFVWEDEDLLGMILIQFQMKIMEQLLLFCSDHNAKNLIIHVDEEQARGMGIYRNVAAYEDKIPGKEGDIIQMIIPASQKTLDNWIYFMDETNQMFRQTLWRDQSYNPAIRNYLKSNPFLDYLT